jgi:hypothetical protein
VTWICRSGSRDRLDCGAEFVGQSFCGHDRVLMRCRQTGWFGQSTIHHSGPDGRWLASWRTCFAETPNSCLKSRAN